MEYNCSAFPNLPNLDDDPQWTNCPRNEYMIKHNLIQCYSKKWLDDYGNFCNGMPCVYDCWSRKDIDEEYLKKGVTITTEYSNDGPV